MGVLYTICSATSEMADWLAESQISIPSVETARMPLLGEICAVLNSLKNYKVDFTENGIGSSWQAMVKSLVEPESGAWTLLNITSLETPSEPQAVWFEKGSPELIVLIVSLIANKSGTLIIIPDTGCPPLVVPPDSNPDELCANWQHINPEQG